MNIYEKFEYLESKGWKYSGGSIQSFITPDGGKVYIHNTLEELIDYIFSDRSDIIGPQPVRS